MPAAVAGVDLPEGLSLPEVEPLPDEVTTVFSPETCLQRAFCAVASNRKRQSEAHKIYYELHGSQAPTAKKLVFVMGLNNTSFGWLLQVDYFAKHDYQVLVMDNRGVGWSDTPSGAYSTEEMARDTIEVLDHIGWTAQRSLSVVGVSMGGMIAQQLARLIPQRILALVLTSTQAGERIEIPGAGQIQHFGKLLFSATFLGPEATVHTVSEALYPREYLDQIDPNTGEKRRVAIEKEFMYRASKSRKQTGKGRISQLRAATRHHVTADQLADIESSVCKVGIIVGDQDKLINPRKSEELHKMMPRADYKIIKGAGHALPSQATEEYHAFIEKQIADAEAVAKAEGNREAR